MTRTALLLVPMLLLALPTACGSGGGAGGQGGGGSGTGAGGTTGTSSTTTTGTTGTVACAVGDRAARTLDAAGGTVSLCGASITVPPGALAQPTEFAIDAVDPPLPPPVDMAFAGPVLRFTPDADILPFQASLFLPRDPADTHYQDLASFDATEQRWYAVESCPADAALTLLSARLGVWAVLRDVNTYPTSALGLGTATVTLDFLGQTHDFQVESSGYAIYESVGDSPDRSVYLDLWRTAASGMEHLDLRMHDAADARALLEVGYYDATSGALWGYLEPIDGPVTQQDIARDADGRLHGTFTVDLHLGADTQTMTGTLDVVPVRYRFPSEGSCGG